MYESQNYIITKLKIEKIMIFIILIYYIYYIDRNLSY